MKLFKFLLLFFYGVSALMLSLGLLTYYAPFQAPPTEQYNMELLTFFIFAFGTSFTILTPLYFSMCFRNTFWLKEKEIEKLEKELQTSRLNYDAATKKLIQKTLEK